MRAEGAAGLGVAGVWRRPAAPLSAALIVATMFATAPAAADDRTALALEFAAAMNPSLPTSLRHQQPLELL